MFRNDATGGRGGFARVSLGIRFACVEMVDGHVHSEWSWDTTDGFNGTNLRSGG